MGHYLIKRLLLIFPTLIGIFLLNFIITQLAPGGPIEQTIARIRGAESEHTGMEFSANIDSETNALYKRYSLAKGLPADFIRDLEKQYGFDKPFWTRFWEMLKRYLSFDFGKSYYQETPVSELIKQKLPTSLTLGFGSIFCIYGLGILLGIYKSLKEGSFFDTASSTVLIFLYSLPSFLLGVFMIVLFSGGSYFDIFPLRGITSDEWDTFSIWQKVKDYFWHITLPISSIVLTNLSSLIFLTKNSFLDEMGRLYVVTARAKGLERSKILSHHIFRNASLPLVAKLPGILSHIILGSNLMIEIVFSLDGLGLLGFEAASTRDYPVMFGCLYIFTLISLVLHLIGDFIYALVDPRVSFEGL